MLRKKENKVLKTKKLRSYLKIAQGSGSRKRTSQKQEDTSLKAFKKNSSNLDNNLSQIEVKRIIQEAARRV